MHFQFSFRVVACVLALVCVSVVARAEEWGTLTGRIVYTGKAPEPAPIVPDKDQATCGAHKLFVEKLIVGKDGGLKDAVIYLRTKKPAIHPDYEKTATDTVVLDNKNCRFEPHVAVLRTTQKLEIKNSDPIPHNSKVVPFANPEINPLIPVGASETATFKSEEAFPMKVGCSIHQWMGAHVVVRSNPYAAVTDEDGNFKIENLPAGKKLEFQLWQETPGMLKTAKIKGLKVDNKGRFKYTLKPGDNDLGDIKVDFPPPKD